MQGTFCFVDLAGFTALTEVHGAETAADLIALFTSCAHEALRSHGKLIDRTGDAIFAVCPTSDEALSFVFELYGQAAAQSHFLALRAGLHRGEALERDGSFYGASVNLAARVAAQATGGQVLLTATVVEAAYRRQLKVSSLGRVDLRNIQHPVELFSVELPKPLWRLVDPVCRMQVDPKHAVGHFLHRGRAYWFCSRTCEEQFIANPGLFVRSQGTRVTSNGQGARGRAAGRRHPSLR